MAKKKAHLSIRAEEYIARELDSIAQKSGLSVTDIVTEYVLNGVEQNSEVFEGAIRVALESEDLALLKQVAKARHKSDDEMAAYLVSRALRFFTR